MGRTSTYLILLIMSLLLFAASGAHAQQRTFINGGFEANDPQGPGAPNWQIFPDSQVLEWTDDTGEIELWDDGFLGVPAYEGKVFAEMNANRLGTLFQNVCLINGETVQWSFAHRARTG